MTSNLDFAARLARFGSTRYQGLREPQVRALSGYAQHADESDLAVELPTGYGKTLVALLIADYALDQGWTVAYLTGNNQLADQVLEQATDLAGIGVAKFSGGNYLPADLASYHDAQIIGVMNYWTYFNTNPKVETADIVMFDDAHLAEHPLAGLFGVRVSRYHQPELYDRLCELVLAHTGDDYPSIELMRSGAPEEVGAHAIPPELLAFTHWGAIANSVAKLLTKGLSEATARFTWPRVRPYLHACGMLIGPSAIEIRPYHPPTQTLPGYRNARQHVYLSATLGTMDDLQRRLGVHRVTNVLDTPVAAGEVGERLFLLYPGDHTPIDDPPIAFALEQSARAGRTTWLCASHAEADAVESLLAERTLTSYRLRGGDDDALDKWSQDPRGHLVTAGRYDGLDLAGDLCRLVIIPSVPAASTEFERFVMAYLGDATYMRHRVGQRVTQALGRANRREGDWAMYLGLAPGFGTLLAQPGVQIAIPSDVRPAVDAALTRLKGGKEACEEAADAFWTSAGSVAETATESRPHRIRPGRSRAPSTPSTADDEVMAVTRLWLGDHQQAAEAAGRAAAALAACQHPDPLLVPSG